MTACSSRADRFYGLSNWRIGLIISENPRFICFQPWKCGSATLYQRLRKFDNNKYPQGKYFNKTLGKITSKHIRLCDFYKLPESHLNYIRFTFVRNPYDRLYSGFLQRRYRLTKRRYRLTKNPSLHLRFNESKEELSSIERGFSDFARFFLDVKIDFIKISKHVYYNNKPAVDYVGFIETFEASFAQICDKIGIDGAGDTSANVRYTEMERETSSSFSTTRYRYIDKFDRDTIRMVNEKLTNDYQPLGYRIIQPNELDEDGQLIDPNLSPFADSIMSNSDGCVLTFDRRNG